MSIFGGIIENRVMSVIKARIADVQQEYDAGVITIDEEAEEKKEVLADECVNKVIGKIL